ncbi:MAG: hypothetical protein OXT67_02590 [Zetaproteobacteria bacterium]|nr:hypothetical protein [Zetaproteobacteria bacterium]
MRLHIPMIRILCCLWSYGLWSSLTWAGETKPKDIKKKLDPKVAVVSVSEGLGEVELELKKYLQGEGRHASLEQVEAKRAEFEVKWKKKRSVQAYKRLAAEVQQERVQTLRAVVARHLVSSYKGHDYEPEEMQQHFWRGVEYYANTVVQRIVSGLAAAQNAHLERLEQDIAGIGAVLKGQKVVHRPDYFFSVDVNFEEYNLSYREQFEHLQQTHLLLQADTNAKRTAKERERRRVFEAHLQEGMASLQEDERYLREYQRKAWELFETEWNSHQPNWAEIHRQCCRHVEQVREEHDRAVAARIRVLRRLGYFFYHDMPKGVWIGVKGGGHFAKSCGKASLRHGPRVVVQGAKKCATLGTQLVVGGGTLLGGAVYLAGKGLYKVGESVLEVAPQVPQKVLTYGTEAYRDLHQGVQQRYADHQSVVAWKAQMLERLQTEGPGAWENASVDMSAFAHLDREELQRVFAIQMKRVLGMSKYRLAPWSRLVSEATSLTRLHFEQLQQQAAKRRVSTVRGYDKAVQQQRKSVYQALDSVTEGLQLVQSRYQIGRAIHAQLQSTPLKEAVIAASARALSPHFYDHHGKWHIRPYRVKDSSTLQGAVECKKALEQSKRVQAEERCKLLESLQAIEDKGHLGELNAYQQRYVTPFANFLYLLQASPPFQTSLLWGSEFAEHYGDLLRHGTASYAQCEAIAQQFFARWRGEEPELASASFADFLQWWKGRYGDLLVGVPLDEIQEAAGREVFVEVQESAEVKQQFEEKYTAFMAPEQLDFASYEFDLACAYCPSGDTLPCRFVHKSDFYAPGRVSVEDDEVLQLPELGEDVHRLSSCGHWVHQTCLQEHTRVSRAEGAAYTCPKCTQPIPYRESDAAAWRTHFGFGQQDEGPVPHEGRGRLGLLWPSHSAAGEG